MSAFVYSTLAAGVDYHIFGKAAEGMPAIKERTISIAGGAGIANKNLITPQGVVTEVTDEEAALLEQHGLFQLHAKNGHVSIQRKRADVDKVVADMDRNDPSAPLTPSDYTDGGDVEDLKPKSNSSRKK